MAVQSSISSRSKSSSHGRLLLCSYGERPMLRTSETKENPGCRFWDCVYYEVHQGCNFFRWTDPETEVEHSEIARIRRKVSVFAAVEFFYGKATVCNSIEPGRVLVVSCDEDEGGAKLVGLASFLGCGSCWVEQLGLVVLLGLPLGLFGCAALLDWAEDGGYVAEATFLLTASLGMG
ncbi:uncharacterized protein DS421_16g529470 [Arachis hypogaea]|nr:uncharacterized protein DS421_16g529470 [Arachis hypogaea]